MSGFSSLEQYRKYLINRRNESSGIKDYSDRLYDSDDNIDSFLEDNTLSRREFIEVIALRRSDGYSKSSGGGAGSAQHQIKMMYQKTPWKFVEEFLQNADDCHYSDTPSIKVIVDERYSKIEFIYNETGFEKSDIWALTSFEQSTKSDETEGNFETEEEGVFYKERTGRKGIGFKSVFSLDAENVIIHIRSNGYSFMLDNKIGQIIPVWEETSEQDPDNTHVIVELVKPGFSINTVYKELRKQFGIDKQDDIFKINPILFLHRLKAIEFIRFGTSGKETFSIATVYEPENLVYNDEFSYTPEKVLSGIRKNGKFYGKQIAPLNICINDGSRSISIACRRLARMIKIRGTYRNISIIVPVINNNSGKWKTGSLFRTFPLFDEQISMPFAIDAPFELNSERRDLNFAHDVFNSEVSAAIFGEKGVFQEMLMYLRNIPDIRMDLYLSTEDSYVYRKDQNRDTSGQPLVHPENISLIAKKLPIFKDYYGKEYLSFNQAVMFPDTIYRWILPDILFEVYKKGNEKKLADAVYSDGNLLSKIDLIDGSFSNLLNSYLDKLEDTNSVSDEMFLRFVQEKIYSYVNENSARLKIKGQDSKIKIFISKISRQNEVVLCRNCVNDNVVWLDSDKPLYSINNYRVLTSSPIDNHLIRKLLGNRVRSIDGVFGKEHIVNSAAKCRNWSEIRSFIEAAKYYGYSINGLKFFELSKYALSEKLDGDYNPYRDLKILKIISDNEILAMAEIFGSVEETIAAVKSMGLRNPKDGLILKDNMYVFREDTIKVLEAEEKQPRKFVLEEARKAIDRDGIRINLFYEKVKNTYIGVKIHFAINRRLFNSESHDDFCKKVLQDSKYWHGGENTNKLLILCLCWVQNPIRYIQPRYVFKLRLEFVIAEGLSKGVKFLVQKKQLNNIVLKNDGYFTQIHKEEILSKIRLMAPDKYDSCKNIIFYQGDFLVAKNKVDYLYDSAAKEVYLDNEGGDYLEALKAYLSVNVSPATIELARTLEQSVFDVYENIIASSLRETNDNAQIAYKNIMDKNDLSEEQFIKVLSWFRYQGYSEAYGSGNQIIQKEIVEEYKNDPWKFVYEFIQNVDDCEFHAETEPELKIDIDESQGRIRFIYNEQGFTRRDIESLLSFGVSQKGKKLDRIPEIGVFDREKTGRKGRGFKSVFALPGDDTAVHINSNGYTFAIYKRLGQIIPIWEKTEARENGTEIIIENFRKETVKGLYQKLREVFCINGRKDIFSRCPVLFLRKLHSVTVSSGNSSFVLSLLFTEKMFSEEEMPVRSKDLIRSGIIKDGIFRKRLWEEGLLTVKEAKIPECNIPVGKYSEMIDLNGKYAAISFLTPLFKNSETDFLWGSLFKTLPLTDNSYKLPIAINAPFEVDNARKKIADLVQTNGALLKEIRTDGLQYLFQCLLKRGVNIEAYVPKGICKAAHNYKYLQAVDFRNIIQNLDILEKYDSSGYVSINNAVFLPEEMYGWEAPYDLQKILSDNNGELISYKYHTAGLDVKVLNPISLQFVKYLNAYINHIQNIDGFVKLLGSKILPYIESQFEAIRKTYHAEERDEELKELEVFCFEMADGSIVLENAKNNTWMTDCPEGLNSYGTFRSVCCTHYNYNKDWVKKIHTIVPFKNAFNGRSLSTNTINSWDSASVLIETLLYYKAKNNIGIRVPFIEKCVLEEKYAPERNLFRDAYIVTGDIRILKHIITEEDIIKIYDDLIDLTDLDDNDILKVLNNLGLQKGTYFFEDDKVNFILSSSTLAIFCSYCDSLPKTKDVLEVLKASIEEENRRGYEKDIHLRYGDIQECRDIFFAGLFTSGLLNEKCTKEIARDYYSDINRNDASVDRVHALMEARLCCKADYRLPNKKLTIRLSDILSHHLGDKVRDCTLKYSGETDILIQLDIPSEVYRSQSISTALDWINDESENRQMEIPYQKADIEAAFERKEKLYLFDSEKVILNTNTVEPSLYAYIHDRYKKEDKVFANLVEIIEQQNQLKGKWTGTKKEYINSLAKFRKSTATLEKVLYPGYADHINRATGDSFSYIIPELLQNINDCNYSKSDPRFLYISLDINTYEMVLSYNEDGFDYSNVYSITALGQSSKHDKREGEKGLGFKKVFTLFNEVEIYSNDFCFSISDKSQTVPQWIDDKSRQKEFLKNGITTMVFKTTKEREKEFRSVCNQWERTFEDGGFEENSSVLFLNNIDSYTLSKADIVKEFTREELLKNYILVEYPLLLTYRDNLFRNKPGNNSINFENLKEKLKSRRKCQLMESDKEKEEFLNNLTIQLAIPIRVDDRNKVNGKYYSTLPTVRRTYSSFSINVSLELTTGRNEIDMNSTYNHEIFKILFDNCGAGKSLMGFIISELAIKNPKLDIYAYLSSALDKYFDVIISGMGIRDRKESDLMKERMKKEYAKLEIFHAYPFRKNVSLADSYLLENIIYKYIVKVKKPRNDIENWVNGKYPKTKSRKMIEIRNGIDTNYESILTYAKKCGITDEWYPFTGKEVPLSINYFSDEYSG